jgi:hypothetical protein
MFVCISVHIIFNAPINWKYHGVSFSCTGQDLILQSHEFKNFGIINLIAALSSLFIFSMLIRAAVSITDEAQKLGFLVNRAMIQTDHKPLKEILAQFNSQIIQRNIPISNEFFNIDWKLLYSVIF